MHGDITFPINLLNYERNFYPLWNQWPSFSNLDEIDRLSLMVPLLTLAKWAHLEIGLYSRLFLFSISLVGSMTIIFGKRYLETYFLGDDFPESWGRVASDVIAALIFTFNPWSLYRISAPFFELSYAMSPLIVAFQLEFLLKGTLRPLIFASIAWTLASGSPQYTVFIGALSLALFFGMRKPTVIRSRTIALRYIMLLAGYALLNLHWIGVAFTITRLENISPGYTLNWNDVLVFSSASSFFNVISGTDFWVDWWKNRNPFAVGPMEIISAIFRPLIFLAALIIACRYFKNRFMRFSVGAFVVLVLLLQGAHGPLGPLYRAMTFGVVPAYGWIVRAPEKFGAFLWLFISLTIGFGLAIHFQRRSVRYINRMSLGFLLVIGVAWFPLIYGTLLTKYVPVPIPSSYQSLWSDTRLRSGKILVLADYESNSQYVSGDAVFNWAPERMAGFVVARSLPLPTFGGYHFQNPFSHFYSIIKSGGPKRLEAFANVLGTRFVLLEHDIEGDDRWYRRWRAGVIKNGARLLLETKDFGLFEYSKVSHAEVQTGPYSVLVGDGSSILTLIDRFGTQLGHRNLFFSDQRLPHTIEYFEGASQLILANRMVTDAAAETFPRESYVPLFSAVSNNRLDEGWAHFRLNNLFEEGGGGWDVWQARGLGFRESFPLDLGLGIISTAVSGARVSLDLHPVHTASDVWVRTLDFGGLRRPTFEIRIAGQSRRYRGHGGRAVWRWVKMATIPSSDSLRLDVESIAGAPAVNAFLIVPQGELERRTERLKRSMGSRIVSLDRFHQLDRWPDATTSTSGRETRLRMASILNESFDPLWTSGNLDERPTPAWLFATGFAPSQTFDPIYLPQVLLLRWWAIEWKLVLTLIALLIISRVSLLYSVKRAREQH